jgi:hypothetical protein
VWYIAGAAMVAISLATQPQDPAKAARNVFAGLTAPWSGWGDIRSFADVLFLCTVVLWLSL